MVLSGGTVTAQNSAPASWRDSQASAAYNNFSELAAAMTQAEEAHHFFDFQRRGQHLRRTA